MTITRRELLLALTAPAASIVPGLRSSQRAHDRPHRPLLDFHVHLFGVGDGGSGCVIADKQRRHWNYAFLLRLLDLRENGRMDEDYVQRLVSQLRDSSIDKAVLQAWDCRYDERGTPDWERTTSVFVPNDYLFRIVERYPDLFVPCVSINPKRRDALEQLDRSVARGARVLKIHPPTQDVDPGAPRFRAFFRHCAEKKVVVMVHTGAEHSAETVGIENCHPNKLRLALEEGCTVIAAHAGMSAFFDREDFYPSLVSLIRSFPNLYCDTAVLASMFRWRNLPRILETPEVLERLIHGSDFPFPSNPLVFWNRLSPYTVGSLLGQPNLLERDYRLKLGLGLPQSAFERGGELLGTKIGAIALDQNLQRST